MKSMIFIMSCCIVFLSVALSIGEAQEVYPETRYHILNTNYVALTYKHPHLWAVTEEKGLVRWNFADHPPTVEQYKELSGITSLYKTPSDTIYIGNKYGEILAYHPTDNTWNHVYSVYTPVYGMCSFDTSLQYAITNNGVIDVIAHKLHRPSRSMNARFNYPKWDILNVPSAILCDSQHNIWIGYHEGESGGDIQVFHTLHQEYLSVEIDSEDILLEGGQQIPLIEILPVMSIVEGSNNTVYITSGLYDIIKLGAILQFQNVSPQRNTNQKMAQISPMYVGTSIFFSLSFEEEKGEYVGPGCVNPSNNMLYYYSNKGFYALELDAEENTFTKRLFFQPALMRKEKGEQAVEVPMNVITCEFIDEHTMVFLTKSHGIGIFDGERITYYK